MYDLTGVLAVLEEDAVPSLVLRPPLLWQGRAGSE